MKLLMFMFLAGCAVKCDESNYYVIEMPVEDTPIRTGQRNNLQIYWNVPTMQCRSKKIPFEDLNQFGIIQNKNDDFQGEKIVILYDPGFFPALFRNESSGQLRYRNGGVPQEGDLQQHLKSFRIDLNRSIPDENFSGVAIIDFESWRPIFRQNFGEVHPYQSVSYEIEKEKHWWWTPAWIRAEAKQRFEEAARIFMQNTISLAKQMRPKARWGYYGFPYCFNMAKNNMKEACADKVNLENDQIDWLWMESTALYPSVYSSKDLTTLQLRKLIRGRVREAARVIRPDTPILPYFWFRYRDGDYLTLTDLQAALQTFNQSEASGFLIWGSSNDVNTVEKCHKLHKYIYSVFGPAIAKYTKSNPKEGVQLYDNVITVEYETTDSLTTLDEIDDDNVYKTTTEPSTLIDSTITTNDVTIEESEYSITTEAIQGYTEKEIIKKNNDGNTEPDLRSLIDILLSNIFNSNNTDNQTNLNDKVAKSEDNTTFENSTINLNTENSELVKTSTYRVTDQVLSNTYKEGNPKDLNNVVSTESVTKDVTPTENTAPTIDVTYENDQNFTSTTNISDNSTDTNVRIMSTSVGLDNERNIINNQRVTPIENNLVNSDNKTVKSDSSKNTMINGITTSSSSFDPITHKDVIETSTNQMTSAPEQALENDLVWQIKEKIHTKNPVKDNNEEHQSITSTEDNSIKTENEQNITSTQNTKVNYSLYPSTPKAIETTTYQVALSPESVLTNDYKKTEANEENTTKNMADDVTNFRTNKVTKNPDNSGVETSYLDDKLHLSTLLSTLSQTERVTKMNTLFQNTMNNLTTTTSFNLKTSTDEKLTEVTTTSKPLNTETSYSINNDTEVTTETNNIFFNQDTLLQDLTDSNEITSPKIISTRQDTYSINITNKRESLSDSTKAIAKDEVQDDETEGSTNEDLTVTSVPESLASGTTSKQVGSSAHMTRTKYIFCIVFYFSVSKCLCDYYGQC